MWIYAGAGKITDLPGSVRAVNAYQLLPVEAGQVIGAALPFAEVALGLVLLAGLGVRVAALASAVLLAGFVVGIAAAWARGLRIDCGCFGGGGALAAGESPRYFIDVVRDLALLAASALLAMWPGTRFAVDNLASDQEIP